MSDSSSRSKERAEIRLFVGVWPDQQVLPTLQQYLAGIRADCGSHPIRWVQPQNLHITLQFLGNVDRGRVPAIANALKLAAASCAPADVRVRQHVGGLRAGVLWLDVDSPELEAMQHSVSQRLAATGLAADRRRFTPHLTIGRLKSKMAPLNLRIPRSAIDASQPVAEWSATDFALIESRLTGEGSVYVSLATFALGSSSE